MPLLLLLVQAALGASADAFLIGWDALGFAPAQPEVEARGPEGIEAGPEGRLAFWDPVRGEVVLLEDDRIARRIRVRAADDLLLLERDLLLLDRAAREVQRWSLDGRLRERRALPALTPSGIRLAEQGGEVFGADLFGNRHPLFALEEGGITAPRTPGIAAPVTAVRWERAPAEGPRRMVTEGLEVPLPDALEASGQRFGDWLVVDAVVADRPLRVERRAWHVPTGESVELLVRGRLYAPRGDVAVDPDGRLVVLTPRAEGLQVLRVSP